MKFASTPRRRFLNNTAVSAVGFPFVRTIGSRETDAESSKPGFAVVSLGRSSRKRLMLAFGLVAALSLATARAGSANDGPSLAPYFTPATPSPKAPNSEGFLQRWLLLEPIKKPFRNSNAGFSEPFVRNAITNQYVPTQSTFVPRDGDKVTVAGDELTWHALDATGYNIKLFRFADNLKKQLYGVQFWAVTVVDSPRDMENVRLAVGSNAASIWWVNGQEAVALFTDRRMVMDDCVSKRLTLHKGRNVICGSVINGPGMSDFCARLIDENGNPVKDLIINLENAGT
ncbi:MAG TPA: acetylxylan esterase [Verrucomicrobiae bacterium]|nr:acetylxylan esterase [Verrucomicrobiae bacterium]